MKRPDLAIERIPLYFDTSENLLWLSQHCENDAYLSMRLIFELMAIPLSKQLTAIAGNLWSRTLIGGRAERNEYLLLHEFHKLGYILPDKQYQAPCTRVVEKSKNKNARTAKLVAGQSANALPEGDEEDDDDEAAGALLNY
jgi:DNA polymerase alpha subunit A